MEPLSKRAKVQRVTLACLACRSRKTRCDGRQPVCIACENRGVAASCSYEQNANKRSLEQRAAPSRSVPPPSQTTPASRPIAVPSEPSRTVDGMAIYMGEGSVDGLATVPSYSEADNLYGASSSIAFSRSLDAELASHGSGGHNTISSSRLRPTLQGRSLEYDDTLSVLPRRRNAEDFVQCFWDFVHPVFPILHKMTFMKQYEQLWSSTERSSTDDNALRDAEDIVFMATLNLVFALGSKLSPNIAPAQRERIADSFYQRARRTFSLDLLDSPTLSVIQMLLLDGVYLQSTYYASRCWNIVGLAIRVAQSFRLHEEFGGSQRQSQLRTEMGRRIWHNCVALDRSV